MSSHGRRRFNGLELVLLIVFDFVLMDRIWASDETCGEINGQILCYFKAWDFGVGWDAAWELCNSRNATLPAIRNRNEQDVFEKFLNMHLSGSAVWTSGRNYTYDDWTWLDGRPYSGRDDGYLLHRTMYSRYDKYRHILLRNYICQYSGDACNYFNGTLNVTNGCIILSDDRRSWYDARNQCLITGGDLAVIDVDDLGYNFPYSSKRRSPQWIGLRKTYWRWNLNKNASEEDDIKYTNWSYDWDPLLGDCISIDVLNGAWSATECSDKLKVVCQTDFVNMTSSKPDNSLLLSYVERESRSVSYSTFIAVVIVGICIIVISNLIVAFVVRKYVHHRTAHVTSNRETTSDRRYQDLETTRGQANPDGTYTELQLQPLYEEVCRRGN